MAVVAEVPPVRVILTEYVPAAVEVIAPSSMNQYVWAVSALETEAALNAVRKESVQAVVASSRLQSTRIEVIAGADVGERVRVNAVGAPTTTREILPSRRQMPAVGMARESPATAVMVVPIAVAAAA